MLYLATGLTIGDQRQCCYLEDVVYVVQPVGNIPDLDIRPASFRGIGQGTRPEGIVSNFVAALIDPLSDEEITALAHYLLIFSACSAKVRSLEKIMRKS